MVAVVTVRTSVRMAGVDSDGDCEEGDGERGGVSNMG